MTLEQDSTINTKIIPYIVNGKSKTNLITIFDEIERKINGGEIEELVEKDSFSLFVWIGATALSQHGPFVYF